MNEKMNSLSIAGQIMCIEITSRLVSANDFYLRVVKNPKRTSESSSE